jgi:transposase
LTVAERVCAFPESGSIAGIWEGTMKKRYFVRLTETQRRRLRELISKGTAPAYRLCRARILLKADGNQTRPSLFNKQIAESLETSESTIERVRRKFVEEGMEAALTRKPQPPRPAKKALDGDGEAHLVALACSKAPEGHARWTLRLLSDRMVKLDYTDHCSYELVRRVLKKTNSNHGSKRSGA